MKQGKTNPISCSLFLCLEFPVHRLCYYAYVRVSISVLLNPFPSLLHLCGEFSFVGVCMTLERVSLSTSCSMSELSFAGSCTWGFLYV